MSQMSQINQHLEMNIRLNYNTSIVKDCKQDDYNQEGVEETKTQPLILTDIIIDKSPLSKNMEQMQQNFEFSKNELNKSTQIEELSLKLNEYIDSYLQELKESSQFLDQISLQQSESYEEEVPENLCQRIYQKFISQISLPIISSCDQISNFDEQSKVCTPLSLSTPISQDVEILTEQNGSNLQNLQTIHLACSFPLIQS